MNYGDGDDDLVVLHAERKHKWPTALLLPFDYFGLTRFYLGLYVTGTIQLLLSLFILALILVVPSIGSVFVAVWIVLPVVLIWKAIDTVRILYSALTMSRYLPFRSLALSEGETDNRIAFVLALLALPLAIWPMFIVFGGLF